MKIRALCKAHQVMELLAFPRTIALSRKDLNSCFRTLVLPRLFDVEFLDLRRVSISSELNCFLLSMCIEAPESTTNILSSGDFVMNMGALSLVFIELIFFSSSATLLCEPNSLALRFPHVIFPRTWARKDCAHEANTFLDFKEFLDWCLMPPEIFTLCPADAFDANLPSFR